jgi:hypothetical protein
MELSKPEDIVTETIQQRGQIYGEAHHSHSNIGLSWTGILQQHYGITLPTVIPPHVVELMMVAFKVQRSTRVYHPDNYVDLAAYARFAEHAQAHPGEPYTK